MTPSCGRRGTYKCRAHRKLVGPEYDSVVCVCMFVYVCVVCVSECVCQRDRARTLAGMCKWAQKRTRTQLKLGGCDVYLHKALTKLLTAN